MGLKVAIVVLACRNYSAFELSMAAHARYLNPDVPIFIIQNCRGTYDSHRTLEVAKRYENLFPRNIKVIADFDPDFPFKNISRLLKSQAFADIDLICKIDDDAFPIEQDWLEKLTAGLMCVLNTNKYAYATPLINNNNWGFEHILHLFEIEKDYFSSIAREHIVGSEFEGRRVISGSQIEVGVDGTIWGYPYIARWVHDKTTFCPDRFVEITANLDPVPIDGKKRYSIGCMLCKKEDWLNLEGDGKDDEYMWQMHCERNNLDIYCVRSVPFIHLAYFTQREENRDIVERAKQMYSKRFRLPFPMGLYRSPSDEIEARLRWLETKLLQDKGI